MAKYSRYDPRNKKSNRHKNQYLGKGHVSRRNRERLQGDIYNDEQTYTQRSLRTLL